ncbi:penicillin-binding transpeptidase domain-containing protein, partial [Synechococcus sp. CS-205]|uniref:penicillin-binding transpeptidase domain-containing protein n=1 Tax=Synechococcus sp. CS-205 TaxID=2847984 RepID=UPI00223A8C3A
AAVINRGVFVPATPFEEISGPNGELLWSRRIDGDKGRRAVDSNIADAMVWMLQRVVTGGTGGAASLRNRPVAGKTGTSEGARDLWFIGGIPQLTTGIWLGYDNNRKTKSDSGSAAAAWGRYMAVVVKDLPVRQFPPKPVLTGTFKPTKPAKSTAQPGRPSNLPTPGEDRSQPEPAQLPPPTDRESDLPALPDLPEEPPQSLPPRGRESGAGPEPTPARPAPRRPAPAPTQPPPVAPPPTVNPSFPVAPPPVAPPPVAPPAPVAPPPVP